ncbi:MAG: Hsp20 family protein [Pseudomonadota bacterium]
MKHFDLTPLYRSTVGFDRVASILDSFAKVDLEPTGFPPYDIIRRNENDYRITLAVSGFSRQELDIEARENTLTIKGSKTAEERNEGHTMLHKGIAGRNFVRRFQLADYVEVKSAQLENGLLHIDLAREIPEAMKPRSINIEDKNTLIEDKA